MKRLTILFLTALTLVCGVSRLHSQTTAFTYQGRLTDGSAPANGSYDVRFILFNAGVGGSQIGPLLTNSPIAVANGLFTTQLDFGASLFSGGTNYWLELAVRTNGVGSFTTLGSRQSLAPTPYALYASN